MTCTKCNHKHWDNKETCMYCIGNDENGSVFCGCGWDKVRDEEAEDENEGGEEPTVKQTQKL